MFSEKLNHLMLLTKTTNTEIANYLNVNQSLISRFRSGNREPSGNSLYIKNISTYLAKKIENEGLIEKVMTSLNFSAQNNISESIENWLSSNWEVNTNVFVHSASEDYYFYGDAGKREASIKFMTECIAAKSPKLLLYSDENMN